MPGTEILFTGSVPLGPASAVFEALQRHCGPNLTRVPDGEQRDWVFGAWNVLAQHPGIGVRQGEISTTADTPFAGMRSPEFVLRDGFGPEDVEIADFGMSETITDSYRQLKVLKDEGVVPRHVRLQATLAGPGTTGGLLMCPWPEMLAIVQPPLIADVKAFAAAIPAHELAVQIDLAGEIEAEELRRNPDGFDVPVIAKLSRTWGDWDLETLMLASAQIADHVPAGAELGFHLCGLWHIAGGGQDLQVHVDAANLLAELVNRPIAYVHMPVLPEHGPDDFAKLSGLRLRPETKLFLGLIHLTDGLPGARRRIELASAVIPDFGVGYFCGARDLNGVGPGRLDEFLELHGQVADL